jgi:hypothetical protein
MAAVALATALGSGDWLSGFLCNHNETPASEERRDVQRLPDQYREPNPYRKNGGERAEELQTLDQARVGPAGHAG